MEGVTLEIDNQYGEVVASAISDKNGNYRAGPLYDDQQYTVSASHPGFLFSVVDDDDPISTTFRSVQLGRARVQVVDQESGAPIGGVLLVMSGGTSYKGKNSTDRESGDVLFDRLFPGSYFVRPVLKEYEFEPSSISFEVEEGVEAAVEIRALRVSFSCLGSVRSVVGDPERGVSVTARVVGKESQEEEVQTDASGSFRLRGLQPHTTYEVAVQTGARVVRAIPPTVTVSMEEEDVSGIAFVTLRPLKKYDITGTVLCKSEYLSSLTVRKHSGIPLQSGVVLCMFIECAPHHKHCRCMYSRKTVRCQL